ncbi:hypothetical protein EK904_006030 [Melospiza melodia maxima]|nr:hypothetical protein EK904_006030 [Melospiza melodia maxima]
MNAVSHQGQNEFSPSRSELSSSHVVPPRSPGSGPGRVPQQPSARGGEFSEPGIDSKNILNDLNCHQDCQAVVFDLNQCSFNRCLVVGEEEEGAQSNLGTRYCVREVLSSFMNVELCRFHGQDDLHLN